MNKFIKVLSISALCFSIFNVNSFKNPTKVSADEYFYNDNGIYISKENFLKLKSLGFTDREINFIEVEEFEKLISYSVIDTKVYTNQPLEIIETNYLMTVNNLTSSENYTDSDYRKTFTLHASFMEEINGQDVFFVKSTLVWDQNPIFRYDDVISISKSDNLHFLPHYLNGTQYPWVRGAINYKETIVNKINGEITYEYEHYVNEFFEPYDTSNIKIESNGVIGKINLPDNNAKTTTDDEGNEYYEGKTYTEIVVSLYAYFIPESLPVNTPTQVVGTFSGGYIHNNIIPLVNFNNVTISINLPYISLSTTEEIDLTDSLSGKLTLINVFTVTEPTC